MFSVNIDKLTKMTPKEGKCYAKTANTVSKLMENQGNVLGIVGNGTSAFKLAATFMEQEKKVLFIDADMEDTVFLGKYKLGKNLKGIVNLISDEVDANELICVTNRAKLDVIFTGCSEENKKLDVKKTSMRADLHAYAKDYDLVVVWSDAEGDVASLCDAMVLMIEQSAYGENSARVRVKELDENGCLVLGVIIDGE